MLAAHELMRCVNSHKTKQLSSYLPLHVGMRLLLYSKTCVRFGLMNGCECILEGIVFADEEELPMAAVSGDYINLKFIPVSLLLRVPNVAWFCPAASCPLFPPTCVVEVHSSWHPARHTSECKQVTTPTYRFVALSSLFFLLTPASYMVHRARQWKQYKPCKGRHAWTVQPIG